MSRLMNTYFKIIIIVSSLFFITAPGFARSSNNEGIQFMNNSPWEEVMSEALKNNKLVFVDCYTSWCGPCKFLERNIFPQKEVGDFINSNFISVKYDMEKPAGLAFGKQYAGEVRNYPTMIIIDPETRKIKYKFVGKRSAEELIFETKKGLKNVSLTELDQRFKNGERDYPFIKDYVLSLSLEAKEKELAEVIDSYFEKKQSFDELLNDQEKWEFFSSYILDAQSNYVQFIINNYSSLSRKKYVDKEMLHRKLSMTIFSGCNDLLNMNLDSLQLSELKLNNKFRDVLYNNLKRLPRAELRESSIAILKLYDKLATNDLEGAYEVLKYMQCFEMDIALRKNYLNVCAYVSMKSANKQLVNSVLSDLYKNQADGERSMMSYNSYNYIAFVLQQAGNDKEAKESMCKYDNIRKERDAKLNKNKRK